MSKEAWCAILILFCLGWVTFCARGEVKVPELSGRVTDEARIFSGADKERLEAAIVALEQATGGQMVVWTLPSLEGDTIESAGIRAADQWKIGHEKEDDGAILLIAPNDREMRLEIGYGWEGPVNDARAGDIIRGMAEFFRNGSYGEGSVYAVNKVREFVTGKVSKAAPKARQSNKAAPRNEAVQRKEAERSDEESMFGIPMWLVIVIFCGLFLILIWYPRSGSGDGGGGGFHGGGFRGGGFRGGGFGGGGGGFRGGGGGFGGGGASGKWCGVWIEAQSY